MVGKLVVDVRVGRLELIMGVVVVVVVVKLVVDVRVGRSELIMGVVVVVVVKLQ